MTIPQNKNVRQLVWHVDTAVEGSELYPYNTEGIKNSVVTQASAQRDVIRLEHEISKFTHGEFGNIRRLPHRCQRTVDALGGYFEGL